MNTSISGSMAAMGHMRMHRPDPSQMASNLFSKLDTQNKGYLEKSDLQSAFDKIAGSAGSTSVDDVFQQFDSDSDGKISKEEMSSGFSKLAETLDSQFNNMRMSGFGGPQGMNGMPPPPPQGGPGGDDAGFSKDELTQQLSEIGSSDSKRSELIGKIVDNFDKADTDGDGKVSFKEAMAYDKSTSGADVSAATSSVTASEGGEAAVMKKIMQLMHAYGGIAQDFSQSASAGSLSVSA